MAQLGNKVNPPVEQEFDTFVLNGGLDLTTPKALVEKGTLLDCSNREVVDLIGYKGIDGIEHFDGRIVAQNEFFYISADSYSGTLATDFPEGSLLVNENVNDDKVFGKVVATATIDSKPSIIYARINQSVEPRNTTGWPSNLKIVDVYGGGNPNFVVTVGPSVYSDSDAQTTVDTYNTYNTSLRDDVGTVAANAGDANFFVHGLHWFRDRLYGVADELLFAFEQTSGTTPLYPNMVLKAGGLEVRIINVVVTSGSFAAGTAVGEFQAYIQQGSAFVDVSYTGTNLSGGPNANFEYSETAQLSSENKVYATLWEAKSEQQAINEDASTSTVGWNRIGLGWEFDFEVGYSTSGDLIKVTRSSDNNFTYTTTSSANNYPEETYNGANVDLLPFAPNSWFPIGNLVENGFPGWKSSASSSVFATDETLDTAITAASGTTAYANFWYRYAADRGNIMFARDKDILGPANEGSIGTDLGGPSVPSAGAVTLDSDWYSTQVRAPIILKNFASAFTAIPVGAVLTGIAVNVSYTSRHYALGKFQSSRITGAQLRDSVITAMNGTPKWGAAVVQVDANDLALASYSGTPQYTPVTIETDTGDYTTQSTSSGGIAVHRVAQTTALTGLTATIGGSGNTFGLSDLSREFWIDEDVGIAIFGQIDVTPALSVGVNSFNPGGTTTQYEQVEGQVRVNVDEIKVTFYYTEPSARYYVGDGVNNGGTANVCSIDVIYTLTTDGTWESRSAEGKIQGTNIISDVTGTKSSIVTGDRLYLTQAEAENDVGFTDGTSIATVTSDMIYNGLPSLRNMINANSRFQFITANFYANEAWDGFYGVSGAGKAFSFYSFDPDGLGTTYNYLINIYTNPLDVEGDTPRSIAYHHNALALGYPGGIVRFSTPGEPENFSGLSGAAEIGVGDRVTGLLSMKGTTLGVFCENSIRGIAGTDADNYQTTVLAPNTGAIEYTIVDMGIPVYCNSSGISTLEQSEKYGNFLGQRLSASVSPFILPRMIKESDQFVGDGVTCAYPVRSKNQYRACFKDGRVLVMTMAPDGTPSFTFSNIYLNQTAVTQTSRYLVPFAWSSQFDDKGKERIHVSHYSTTSDATSYYVYEMDVGWSFAGNFIPSYYTINWFNQDPFTESTIRNFRVDGLTRGYSSCKITCAKDYDTTFSTANVDISLPRSPASSYQSEFFPASNMAHVAERGRNISLKISSEIPSGDAITDPIPPDIHQVAFLQYGPGGKRDS